MICHKYKSVLFIFVLIVMPNVYASYHLSSTHAALNRVPLWSILMCTLDERTECFDHIFSKLTQQIEKYDLSDEVEIVYCKDDREYSVGYKRNQLLQKSKGSYVNFIDDDDDVHDEYVKIIYDALRQNPDCVSLVGVITFDGVCPRYFIHSLNYDSYFEENSIYYRPPNHLNTMRREIAIQFAFPEMNYGEDTDWALRVASSGLLQSEVEITEPYYFYKFVTKK